jgi:hypothetical protein
MKTEIEKQEEITNSHLEAAKRNLELSTKIAAEKDKIADAGETPNSLQKE